MDVYVLWPRCSWTWSSAVSMVEKIHHEDAIGNILYNTKSTNHWTKSLHAALYLILIFNFLHYYQFYYKIAYFLRKHGLKRILIWTDKTTIWFFIWRLRNVYYNNNITLSYFQTQFGLVVIHTGYNMMTDCEFPQGFNYAVFIYAFTLIALFSNFYIKAYSKKSTKNS